MKKIRRAMVGTGIALAVLIALEVFLCVWFFGAKYPFFDKYFRETAPIAGLRDGFSPQGLCVTDQGEYVVSGYMANGSASRVYFIDPTDGKSRYITVSEGGKTLKTHFGGVACTQDYLYLASGDRIVRISLPQARSAAAGANVSATDSFSTGMDNAFCSIYGGMLFAGEFYRKGNYETAMDHRITENGETNYAFVYAYELDESKEGGVTGSPRFTVSVRGLVQGFAVTEEHIYLSCSYGLPDSKLYIYDNPITPATSGVVRLDSSSLRMTRTLPCMSEGIAVADGELHVLFESACTKYNLFVRRDIRSLGTLSLDVLLSEEIA